MNRRTFFTAVAAGTILNFSNGAFAQFGSLGKLKDASKGSSGKTDNNAGDTISSWKEAADLFASAKTEFSAAVSSLANISADIADALELKSEAAVLRQEAKSLQSKGDTMGTADLDVISKNSESTNELISAKLEAAGDLSSDQVAALGKAAVDYVPLMINTLGVAKKVKDTVSGVSELGTPGFTDDKAALSAAKDIPSLGPKMVTFTVDSVKTGSSLLKLMNTKGVATPDMSELDSQFSDFT